MITNKFEYPEVNRINNELGIFYLDNNKNQIPSVTTVLDNMSDKKASIESWRLRVGNEEADRVMKKATDIGSMVHLALENYLHNEEKDIFTNDTNGSIAKKIYQKFIDDVVGEITEVYGLEVNLFLENLYAGTADCVGTINGIESIIDFKTTRRIKQKEWIDDYFLQGCAYANAHNVM